jgi:hypothetical protein
VSSFRDLARHFGALPPRTVASLTGIAEARDEFTVSAVRENAPGISDAHISKVLAELKGAGIIEPLGTGRGARWRRLNTADRAR